MSSAVEEGANSPTAARLHTTFQERVPNHLSVTARLEEEHRELNSGLGDVRRLVAAGDFESAQNEFVGFAERYLRHMAAEERVLFPIFEEVTGIKEGPTKALRCDHCKFRKLFGAVAQSIVAEPKEHSDAVLSCLVDVLASHGAGEEQLLYAACNEAVRDVVVRDVILRKIEEYRAPENEVGLDGIPHKCDGAGHEHEHDHAADCPAQA